MTKEEKALRQALERAERKHGRDSKEAATAMSELANWLGGDSDQYEEAAALFGRVVAHNQKHGAIEHAVTLDFMFCQACCLDNMNDLAGAERVLKELINTASRVLPPGHEDRRQYLERLASVLEQQGKSKECEAVYDRVLHEAKLLGDSSALLPVLDELGELALAREDGAKTVAIRRRSLAIRLNELGPEHEDTLHNQMTLHAGLGTEGGGGSYEEREKLALQVYETAARVLGELHSVTVWALLEAFWYSTKESPEAVAFADAYFKRVGDQIEKLNRPEDAQTLVKLRDVADAYDRKDARAKSQRLYARVLAAQSRILGWAHEASLKTLNDSLRGTPSAKGIAHVQGHFERSWTADGSENAPRLTNDAAGLKEFSRVLTENGAAEAAALLVSQRAKQKGKAFGPEHPETLEAMHQEAENYLKIGELDKARSILRRLIPLQEKVLGKNSPGTLQSHHNLGLSSSIGDDSREREIINAFRQAASGREQVLGADHADTLESCIKLAEALSTYGWEDEAETIARRVVEARERTLGPEAPDTLDALDILGEALSNRNMWPECEVLKRRTLTARKNVPGTSEGDLAMEYFLLGNVLTAQHKYEEAIGCFEQAQRGFLTVEVVGNEWAIQAKQNLQSATAKLAKQKKGK